MSRLALFAAWAPLCLAHAQAVAVTSKSLYAEYDPIAAICKRYADVSVFQLNGVDQALSCDAIRQMAVRMKRPQTLMHGFQKQLQAERVEIYQMMNVAPGCVEQRSARQWTVSCPLVIQGAPAKLIFNADSLGVVEGFTLTMPDFRPLLKPAVEDMEAKAPGVAMKPEGWHLMLDIIVANNNAIAPPMESYSRQGDSLTVRVMKTPK